MDHYFTNNINLKSDEKNIKVRINDIDLSFFTDNGVFSKKGLDFGTRVLLNSLPEIKGTVLDIGCGYGPIGIYIMKKYDTLVDMTDINERSIALAKKNAQINAVNPNIVVSDMYQKIVNKYDYIITNPPIRIGKEKLYKMLFDAKNYLKPTGELWLVINKNQGAKSLMNDLTKEYKVQLKNKEKGFYIISCVNN